jgi:hypothetical protein
MKEYSHVFTPSRILLVAAAIALLVGHALVLLYVSEHVVTSAAVMAGVVLVVIVKHLAFLGSLFRRRND